MKNILIGFLVVLLFSGSVVMANNSKGAIDTENKGVTSLLWLVMSDLEMCRSSMTDSLFDNVSAIGHLNNAQSALRKSEITSEYHALISEVDKRISKIKFYLVMNERHSAIDRINQLVSIVRSVLTGSNPGSNIGNAPVSGFYPGNGTPGGINFGPSEITVGGGNNSPISGSMGGFPSGVVPVR